MKTRFIQKYRKGDRVYHPGESADEFSQIALKKLIKEGIVAEMAQPEVEEDER